MESGDSSDEESPPSNSNRNGIMRKEQSKVVSMLVAMKTEDGLRRGAIIVIAKRFGMACCSVYHLWERAKRSHELGIINSPEFISCKRIQKKGYVSNCICMGKFCARCGGRLPHEVLWHFMFIFTVSNCTE